MSRRKLSAPQGWWNRCGTFDNRRTNARCMGPEKPADAISKVLNSEKFPCFTQMGANFAAYDTLACHDETIRAITVIRLNLNPPFKNPRSATGFKEQKWKILSSPCWWQESSNFQRASISINTLGGSCKVLGMDYFWAMHTCENILQKWKGEL